MPLKRMATRIYFNALLAGHRYSLLLLRTALAGMAGASLICGRINQRISPHAHAVSAAQQL